MHACFFHGVAKMIVACVNKEEFIFHCSNGKRKGGLYERFGGWSPWEILHDALSNDNLRKNYIFLIYQGKDEYQLVFLLKYISFVFTKA